MFLTGLVGDILLNNIPLRDFTIYSLDMKPSFIDRCVCFIESNILHIAFILCLTWMPYFSLYQAPWKSLSESASFPGFFMGRLFVYGYPSDTFVKLPVSDSKPFLTSFFPTCCLYKKFFIYSFWNNYVWVYRAGRKVLCLSMAWIWVAIGPLAPSRLFISPAPFSIVELTR